VPGKEIKSDQGALHRHVEKDNVDLPFQAHFSHVKVRHTIASHIEKADVQSNFVTITALFDTVKVPSQLKP